MSIGQDDNSFCDFTIRFVHKGMYVMHICMFFYFCFLLNAHFTHLPSSYPVCILWVIYTLCNAGMCIVDRHVMIKGVKQHVVVWFPPLVCF